MTTRTDIHRPSSPDFDPESYELFGIFQITLKVKKLVGYTNDGTYMIPQFETVDSPLKIALTELRSKGWRTDDIGDRDSVIGNQCAHCGAHIQYGALLTYAKDLTLLAVGQDCLENRFESELTAKEFQSLRDAGRLNRTRLNTAERVAEIYSENPKLVEARDSENKFVQDVISKLEKNGELSDRQIAAVKTALVRDAERAEREAVWATEAELAADAPTGKVTVTGEILSVKSQETMFGSTLKMVVKTEAGWKLWVTVPNSIMGTNSGLLNKTVTLTATVTPSDRDSKFAFGKRPTKASLV